MSNIFKKLKTGLLTYWDSFSLSYLKCSSILSKSSTSLRKLEDHCLLISRKKEQQCKTDM